MSIPKVIFKLPRVSKEAEMFQMFCCHALKEFDWSHIIYEAHPEIKKILESKKDQKEAYKELYKYSKDFISKNKHKLEDLRVQYQKEWDSINDLYLKILSEDFETKYPSNRKVITAYVSIVPIYPRFLDSWSFNVGLKSQNMKKIAIHEILHFMYFKKWKEVFPKTKRIELEAPYLVWKLSEILAPILLNNNPKIQKLIKVKDPGYSEFKNIKIGKENLVTHFEKIYKNHIKKETPFTSFLESIWEETKKYKKALDIK